jgi:hypothetical protein
MWDMHELVRIARSGLEGFSRAGAEEQAVYGLDSLSEVELHPLLAEAYAGAGLGVTREWPYPGMAEKRPKFAARARCDVVLTAGPTVSLVDPVAELLEKDKSVGTLFESAARAECAPQAGTTCQACDAFWLEVKVVGQYCYTLGVPGPNRSYSSDLTNSMYTDLAKLGADESLRWAGLLLVLFADEQATAEHDLTIALHRSLDRGFSFKSPILETFAIPDRIGNRICSVALVPR